MEFDFNDSNNNYKIEKPIEIEIKISKFRKSFKTEISGLDHPKIAFDETKLKEHLKLLRRRHKCSGAVYSDPLRLVMAGDLHEQIITYLTEEINIVSPEQITLSGV